jgi:eukaryotic-like serine/threonine-protein kinase
MSSSSIKNIAVGQHVGPYRIEGLLGSGGRGIVYLAQDGELRRTVAIKVVDRSRDRVGAMDLLLREARVAAALSHPAICSVYEIGRLGDEPFVLMEHIAGTPLSAIIPRDGGLPVENVLHYAIQVVDAVAHVHQHDIVHGDLKCSNIMITADGRVKLLDFGLAIQQANKADSGSADADTTEAPDPASGSGTLPYMAPELLRGWRADVRSDIWALGVVLFEMLSGYRPFNGATAYELAAAILGHQPLPLPSRVPADVRGVVSRCLSKRPTVRFGSASDLAAALDDLR